MGTIPGKTIRRVRALLAKAERTEHADEADALNAQAQRLIARYGIEAAMLAEKTGGDRPIGVRMPLTGRYVACKLDLITAVAVPMRCTVLSVLRDRKVVACQVWGFPSDVERAGVVFTSLLVQAEARVATARPPEGARGRLRSYRRSWWSGFIVAVNGRIIAHEREAAEQAEQRHRPTAGNESEPGVGVVARVLADRAAAVERAYRTAHESIGKITSRTPALGGHGLRDGHRAGLEADLGTAGPTPIPSPD